MYVLVCDWCDDKMADEAYALTLEAPNVMLVSPDFSTEDGKTAFHFCSWECVLNATSASLGRTAMPAPEEAQTDEDEIVLREAADLYQAWQRGQQPQEGPKQKIRIKPTQAAPTGGTFSIGGGGSDTQPDDDVPFGGVRRR